MPDVPGVRPALWRLHWLWPAGAGHAKYKGKITFWGELDRQSTLPFGSTADVRAAVARVRQALDDGQGGVIAQPEWGKDVPRESVEAAFTAWLQPSL